MWEYLGKGGAMSGVLKKIGKVFKKVIKVVKKVLPYALIGAAAIFTGGAALGILPTFGTAVGGLVSSLGVGSSLGGVLTGAITKAGIGGLAGLALGGKKGAVSGLMGGALLGAVGGLSGAGGAAAQTAGTATPPSVAGAIPAASTGFSVPIDGSPMAVPGVGTAPAFASSMPSAGGGGLMGMVNNPLIMSQMIQGLGGGIAARSEMRARERAEEKEAANFSVSGGLLDPSNMSGYNPQAGSGQYDQNQQFNWTYDARQGKLVRA